MCVLFMYVCACVRAHVRENVRVCAFAFANNKTAEALCHICA